MILKKSTVVNILFFMRDATDSISPKLGLTPVVTLSKDAGGFGAAAGAVSEVGNGWYALAATIVDSGTIGALALHATGTGADPYDEVHQVTPELPGNLAAATIQAIWDALTSALTTAGSVGKLLVDNITGNAFTRLGAPVGASISADLAAVEANAVAIKAKTDNLPAAPASVGDVTTVGTTATAINTKLGAPAGASVSADIAAVEANAVAIKAKTDNLPAAPASEGNVTAVGALATAIKAKTDNLPAAPASEGNVTAVGSAVVTTNGNVLAVKAKTDNLPSDPADESLIIDATDAIMARIGAPAGASIAADIANIQIDNEAIADAVWDEPLLEHQDPGSTGEGLSLADSGGGGGGVELTDLTGTLDDRNELLATLEDNDIL